MHGSLLTCSIINLFQLKPPHPHLSLSLAYIHQLRDRRYMQPFVNALESTASKRERERWRQRRWNHYRKAHSVGRTRSGARVQLPRTKRLRSVQTNAVAYLNLVRLVVVHFYLSFCLSFIHFQKWNREKSYCKMFAYTHQYQQRGRRPNEMGLSEWVSEFLTLSKNRNVNAMRNGAITKRIKT